MCRGLRAGVRGAEGPADACGVRTERTSASRTGSDVFSYGGGASSGSSRSATDVAGAADEGEGGAEPAWRQMRYAATPTAVVNCAVSAQLSVKRSRTIAASRAVESTLPASRAPVSAPGTGNNRRRFPPRSSNAPPSSSPVTGAKSRSSARTSSSRDDGASSVPRAWLVVTWLDASGGVESDVDGHPDASAGRLRDVRARCGEVERAPGERGAASDMPGKSKRTR